METKYVMLLLLVPFAFSQGPFYDIKGDGLDAAMDNVICKTDFMTGVMGSIMDHADNTNLQDSVDKLNGDLDSLQDLADAGDAAGFRAFIIGTYMPDMREGVQAILSERGRHNVTLETRLELKSEYDSMRSEYDTCNFESMKRFANAKADAYDKALELAGEQASDLSGKGVSTEGLSSLISDAKDEIVDPLHSAIDSADTPAEVRSALLNYCLFDGCPGGKNFHFAAKFGGEKLQSILDYVSDGARAAGLGDKVDEAQDSLDDANSILGSVGDEQYSASQGENLWNDLKDAAAKLREIVTSLRSGQ
ncbi:MAG TPA: hypothetical protein VLD37_01115 [Candidatus Bilamarchaeum sp.]|nr:hypothetical protein [Candidatus Bilamarchaeum sp.]